MPNHDGIAADTGGIDVDEPTRKLIRALFRHAPSPDWPIQRHRDVFESAAPQRPLAVGVTTSSAGLDMPPAEWAVPPDAGPGVILYLHGGGFVMGSLATTRPLATHLAAAAGMRVLYPEYRLAPEYPHPAAARDAYAAYTWLLEQGIDPSRVVIAGDSAGCALALTAMGMMLDEGVPVPGAGVFMSPFLDFSLASASITGNEHIDAQAPRWLLAQMVRAYVGDADPLDPEVCPFRADPGGLPPLLIQVGELEAVRDDGVRFAERARAAGVDVLVQRWSSGIHVWHAFAPRLPAANEALAAVGEWLTARVGQRGG